MINDKPIPSAWAVRRTVTDPLYGELDRSDVAERLTVRPAGLRGVEIRRILLSGTDLEVICSSEDGRLRHHFSYGDFSDLFREAMESAVVSYVSNCGCQYGAASADRAALLLDRLAGALDLARSDLAQSRERIAAKAAATLEA